MTFAKAKEVTSGVFGALAKCVKNLDVKEDPPLVAAVMAELTKVDGKIFTCSAKCKTVVLLTSPLFEKCCGWCT